MRRNIRHTAITVLAFVAAFLLFGSEPMPETPAPPTPIAQQTDETSGRNIFNPNATLNTDQIHYVTESDAIILLPTEANPETTPTIKVDGIWIPEESPIGSYPTGEWLDNSPVYAHGWFLQQNDTTHTVVWREMSPDQYALTHNDPEGL